MAESAAHIYCRPSVHYNIRKWYLEGKCVLEVSVPQSNSGPHHAPDEKGNWIAYVRVADENIKANRVLKEVWKNRNKGEGAYISFNKEEKALIEYLDTKGEITFSKFLKTARISRGQAERILVILILMNALEMKIRKNSTVFRRKSQDPLC
jgi:predicted HTH transcriptional regulator